MMRFDSVLLSEVASQFDLPVDCRGCVVHDDPLTVRVLFGAGPRADRFEVFRPWRTVSWRLSDAVVTEGCDSEPPGASDRLGRDDEDDVQ